MSTLTPEDLRRYREIVQAAESYRRPIEELHRWLASPAGQAYLKAARTAAERRA